MTAPFQRKNQDGRNREASKPHGLLRIDLRRRNDAKIETSARNGGARIVKRARCKGALELTATAREREARLPGGCLWRGKKSP
jgi:hypothetical protein